VGDALRSHDGRWLAVEGVRGTGRAEAVYNCRAAEYHTYFVGCDEWGFSVWAHNSCGPGGGEARTANIGNKLEYLFGRATGDQHNIERSLAMLRQMERIGLPDTPQNRSFMAQFFQTILNDATNVVATQANGRVVRQSLLMGPRGGVMVNSVWEGDRLITFTLIGGR